jgi:hypothetical protein
MIMYIPSIKKLYFCAGLKIKIKNSNMKKLFALVVIAAFLVACNEEVKTDSTSLATDSLSIEANKMADSASAMMNSSADSINKMTDTAHNIMNHAADSIKK